MAFLTKLQTAGGDCGKVVAGASLSQDGSEREAFGETGRTNRLLSPPLAPPEFSQLVFVAAPLKLLYWDCLW